jgi:hypothetical protein
LADDEPIDPNAGAVAKTIAIDIPKANLLTPKSIIKLIDGDLEGAATWSMST